MKRAGHLLDRIAEPENLRLAFWKAAKGKRSQADCRLFQEELEANLDQLREQLMAGGVRVGDYRYFQVFDPKQRLICAASFRERVLHHAIMNICEPALEKTAIFDSYACRRGKGRLAAVHRAQSYARRQGWFLKMDIRKYFDSIDQEILRKMLGKRYKDNLLLDLLERIIASYHTAPGRGLPIGNLTSQHFANYYLGPLDRFIKEGLRRRGYVRYMDDFVVWGESGLELREICIRVKDFLAAELKLEMKPNLALNQTGRGMEFLGYRIFPGTIRLARRSKVRFARKFRKYERAYLTGCWTERQLQQRMEALTAFTLAAESHGCRRRVIERFGVVAKGFEPREPRGQLEQQRQELPHGEPEQEQPGQPEQQPGVPPCPGLSSIPAGESAGTDPAAILPWQSL